MQVHKALCKSQISVNYAKKQFFLMSKKMSERIKKQMLTIKNIYM